jgi:hypothetical protein
MDEGLANGQPLPSMRISAIDGGVDARSWVAISKSMRKKE